MQRGLLKAAPGFGDVDEDEWTLRNDSFDPEFQTYNISSRH
jgi:hypothetical protein